MKIFITGGSGYIGNILANSLSSNSLITLANKKKKITINKIEKLKYKIVNYQSLE